MKTLDFYNHTGRIYRNWRLTERFVEQDLSVKVYGKFRTNLNDFKNEILEILL